MESVWRQTGKKPKELEDLVELPVEMQYVWEYFLRLNKRRTSNGFGVNPITFNEIDSFFRVNQIEYNESEVFILELLDDVVLEHFAKQQEKENKKNNKGKK